MKSYAEIFNLSELLTARVGAAAILSSGIGGFFSWMYGGAFNLMCILSLVLAIGFDWASGISASKKDGSYASAYGLQGVIRTFVMILLPAWGVLLDNIFQTPNIVFFLFFGGIMFHTINSMTANFVRVGWDKWIPVWAIKGVASEIEAKIRRSQDRVPFPEAPPENALHEQAAAIESKYDK